MEEEEEEEEEEEDEEEECDMDSTNFVIRVVNMVDDVITSTCRGLLEFFYGYPTSNVLLALDGTA
jgi:hypothetical protein